MNPLHFGPPGSPLFGVYTPPRSATERRAGVLLCPPLHQEYMRSHWAVRQTALHLARAGFHVFKFDWYGQGDSAGAPEEGDFGRWAEDVRAAAAELREIAGVTTLHAVGFRLGASVACAALSAGAAAFKELVLVDPVMDGRAYLEDLRRLHTERWAAFPYRRNSLHSADCEEIVGFLYSRRTLDSIQGFSFPSAPPAAFSGQTHWLRTAHSTSPEAPGGWAARSVLRRSEERANWDRVEALQEALLLPSLPAAITAALTGGKP